MEVVRTLTNSVFNIQSATMVQFLEDQYRKHQNGEEILLYPHQVEAVLTVKQHFENSNIALVVLPSGCGKTGVAVLASYALNATRVLVITPSITRSSQIHEAYGNFLIERGIIPDKPEVIRCVVPTRSLIEKSSEIYASMRRMVTVVNVHKIGGQSNVRIEDLPRDIFDLVIVDEAHHYPAPTWKVPVDYFSNSRRLFLTATPLHNGKPILSIPPCYELKESVAISKRTTRGSKKQQYSD